MHNAQLIHDYEFYEFYEFYVIAKRFYKAKRLKELYEFYEFIFQTTDSDGLDGILTNMTTGFRTPEDDFTVTATEKSCVCNKV